MIPRMDLTWLLASSLLLSGCMYLVKTKADLQRQPPSRTGEYESNYQQLAKCSDDHGEPISIDFQRKNVTTVYPELGRAEMYAGVFLLVFERLDDARTKVSAYRHGAAMSVVDRYFDILDKCSRGELG